jgi:hypothetical protein
MPLEDLDILQIDIKKEYGYLSNLKEPENDIERSFNQYLCQKYLSNRKRFFLINILSGLVLFPFILYCLRPRLRKKHNFQYDAVYSCPRMGMSIMPKELIKEYSLIFQFKSYDNKFMLEWKDLHFVIPLIRQYIFHSYFLLDTIARIAKYRYYINFCCPRAVIVPFEFIFSSSILTLFCNKEGIEHINIMHGEILNRISHSFSRFNRFYVWNEHYIKLLNKLKCDKNKFIVSNPASLDININKYRKESDLCDYKYYLGKASEMELINICKIIKKLKDYGYKVKIRSHPRFNCNDLLKIYLTIDCIEDFGETGIEASLANAKSVIALYSTVLYQAYCNGIGVVIDDVVYKEQIKQLESVDYIMCSKPHILLSDILKEHQYN